MPKAGAGRVRNRQDDDADSVIAPTPDSLDTTSLGGPLSFPLLEGLCSRPGDSDAIVREVFTRWRAAVHIACVLEKYWKTYKQHGGMVTAHFMQRIENPVLQVQPPKKRRRRGGKIVKQNKKLDLMAPQGENTEALLKTNSTVGSFIFLAPLRHWLIRSMISSSLVERQVAFKILVQGCPVDRSSLWTLIEVLCQLAQIACHFPTHINPSVISCVALLKHTVINVLPSGDRLAFCRSPRVGLTKICSVLWKMAVISNDITKPQCNAGLHVCSSLANLLYAIVLQGVDETTHDTLEILWSSTRSRRKDAESKDQNGYKLSSPLAFLIATHHLLAYCRNEAFMKPYMDQLKTLIDPSTQPETIVCKPQNELCHQVERIKRLAQTFVPRCNAVGGKTEKTIPSTTGADSERKKQSGQSYSTSAIASLQSTGSRARGGSLWESTAKDRGEIDSLARLIGSLHRSNSEYGNCSFEDDANDHERHVADVFHPMNDTDDEDAASEEIDRVPRNTDEFADINETPARDADAQSKEVEGCEANDQESSIRSNEDDEDEEIESDDEDVGEAIIENDEDMDDEDEEGMLIHDDELPAIEQGLLEIRRGIARTATSKTSASERTVQQLVIGIEERSRVYVDASMEVLVEQYPHTSKSAVSPVGRLSIKAEETLLASILSIVQPKKKTFDGKVYLRRAPTQEEFFRGTLSRNPVSFTMLTSENGGSQEEPTVRDLRQHIANELQMQESAELLEILIANKILDVNLKLRVVNQTLWKRHCMQASNAASPVAVASLLGRAPGSRSFYSSSSELSLMLGSSFSRSPWSSAFPSSSNPDNISERLPAMIMMYRLTGVDGEATEDTVTVLDDPQATLESPSGLENELFIEKEFGVTRSITKGRGVICLMKSLERHVSDTLRQIRRDDIGVNDNSTRKRFKHSVCAALSLLLCCANLPANRRLLLNARAPTILLRLLLDVLHALENDVGAEESESNSTAKKLQELIEVLASDISKIAERESDRNIHAASDNIEEDASTLQLLIQSIESSSLSPPLLNIIAKLIPYLTYGMPKLSKKLAVEFVDHVLTDHLREYEESEFRFRRSILMDTFILASISLPTNEVCNCLRTELVGCGFVKRIADFIVRECPTQPPWWSSALWPRGTNLSASERKTSEKQWLDYSTRPGLKSSLDVLIGLSKKHQQTQFFLCNFVLDDITFIQLCHWFEATSDFHGIILKTIALLAETLLDHLMDGEDMSSSVQNIRKVTRERKKEIAMEKRHKALLSISKFRNTGGKLASQATKPMVQSNLSEDRSLTSIEGAPSSLLAPVFGCFHPNEDAALSFRTPCSTSASVSKKKISQSGESSWMNEMEILEDESGLVCSVCREGVKSQPKSLLGLYCYIKKVCLAASSESRLNIDGTTLLTILPTKMPPSLQSSALIVDWYQTGRAAGNELKDAVQLSSASRRRDSYFTTTVSAFNAIHIDCHSKARQADRNHPKAPKSEWEGATLRNSRVNCNVILPLVSARSSEVSLGVVEQALTDHQAAVANLVGSRPKSSLWTVLHDIRLLLLRMAHGEALNADCGGGSLLSNSQLLFYQLSMATSFENEARVDSPASSQHAFALSAGFLAARHIIAAEDYDAVEAPSLIRGIADSSVMAILTCILLHNTEDDDGSSSAVSKKAVNPKRRWVRGKGCFLRGLLNTAGCRYALGLHDSGCVSVRSSGPLRSRSISLNEWGVEEEETTQSHATSGFLRASITGKGDMSDHASIEDFGNALRPFITFYAMMDQLSSVFSPVLDDKAIENAALHFVQTIEACQRSKTIRELLRTSNVTLSHSEITEELQRGMAAA